MTQTKIAEAFPPGEHIQEELEARGWSQLTLAEIIGCHPTVVNAWIKGKRAITPQTAKELGDAFGTSAQLWMNLQSSYDLWKTEATDSAIARRARLYDYAPIKELVRRNWIEESESIDIMQSRILNFYNTTSLDEKPEFACATRRSTPGEITAAQTAWLYRARQLARGVFARPFSDGSFNGAIHELTSLKANAEDIRLIPRVLADFGIKLLVIEHLPQTRIDGATFWLGKHPVIVLSVRYDRIDSFWFTLAHELGHVKYKDGLNHDIPLDTDLVGDEAQPFEEKSEIEKRADAFATDFLVPAPLLDSFIVRKGPLYSQTKIMQFANRIKVHPGIVVGQLHYRRCFHYRYYRKLLEKVKHIVTTSALTDGWGHTPPATLSER